MTTAVPGERNQKPPVNSSTTIAIVMLRARPATTVFVVLLCLTAHVSAGIFNKLRPYGELCAGTEYDHEHMACCEDTLHPRFEGYVCCGKRVYNPKVALCCEKTIIKHQFWMSCENYIILHDAMLLLKNDT
ncbi:hypothetical protein NP493_33g01009 [Ridgeia piscesae]|uniref:Galaxin-like repeats domain-containing protein n=1 Tax=Ridgeia piscesae TaxID=27915 RepID=A0AAD9PCJ9_RIDPI|nr:hypothetical protein NP493_33g01009 [Ridgeia piscesae]